MDHRLYHRTTLEKARSILSEGFRNDVVRPGHTAGVFLSTDPIQRSDLSGDEHALLIIDINLSSDQVRDYKALPAAMPVPYEEWKIPAEIIDTNGKISLHPSVIFIRDGNVVESDDDEITTDEAIRWARMFIGQGVDGAVEIWRGFKKVAVLRGRSDDQLVVEKFE